jgi:Skp family chaperone for outer membrane proteins
MIQRSVSVLILGLACGLCSVFAQAELPEPVFNERGQGVQANQSPGSAGMEADALRYLPSREAASFAEPLFDDVVRYLWGFAPVTLPEPPVLLPAAMFASAASTDAEQEIPHGIRNNQYYLESLRLAKLAQDTYEYGDYDTSAEFASEAIRYAQLSDEYVALQLKIKETNDAIAAAKQRLDWAASSGAAKQFPAEYSEAGGYYNTSLSARSGEEWDAAIESANKVIEILAYVQAPGTGLPAQYTVRPWALSRDCLWNIAGRSWAYGDPYQWRVLYNANKSKLPDPNNPDLIEPGMVLDIPSLNGESRQGMWSSN